MALLGTVTLEVALIARYWTWLFGCLTLASYFLVYPYMVVFPLAGGRLRCAARCAVLRAGLRCTALRYVFLTMRVQRGVA